MENIKLKSLLKHPNQISTRRNSENLEKSNKLLKNKIEKSMNDSILKEGNEKIKLIGNFTKAEIKSKLRS